MNAVILWNYLRLQQSHSTLGNTSAQIGTKSNYDQLSYADFDLPTTQQLEGVTMKTTTSIISHMELGHNRCCLYVQKTPIPNNRVAADNNVISANVQLCLWLGVRRNVSWNLAGCQCVNLHFLDFRCVLPGLMWQQIKWNCKWNVHRNQLRYTAHVDDTTSCCPRVEIMWLNISHEAFGGTDLPGAQSRATSYALFRESNISQSDISTCLAVSPDPVV